MDPRLQQALQILYKKKDEILSKAQSFMNAPIRNQVPEGLSLGQQILERFIFDPKNKRLFPSSPYHVIVDAQKINDSKMREEAMRDVGMNMVMALSAGPKSARGKANYLPNSERYLSTPGKFEMTVLNKAKNIIKRYEYDSDLMAKAQIDKIKGTLKEGEMLTPINDITPDDLIVKKAREINAKPQRLPPVQGGVPPKGVIPKPQAENIVMKKIVHNMQASEGQTIRLTPEENALWGKMMQNPRYKEALNNIQQGNIPKQISEGGVPRGGAKK